MKLQELESLFIEKLTEKYRLTQRDIKRAFIKFDTDGSGFLSTSELTAAIGLFLNGIDRNLIVELVQHYDVDQDGVISIDEFSEFLLSRNSEDKSKWLTVDHLTTSNPQRTQSRQKRGVKEHTVQIHEDQSDSIHYRAKMFLQGMKALLIKQTLDRRREGDISHKERRKYSTNALIEAESKANIHAAFSPLVQSDGVSFASFARVLRRYVPPGTRDVGEDVLRYIFEQCGGSTGVPSSTGASPDILLSLLFDKGATTVNQFGFTHEVKPALSTGRETVGAGPLRVPRPSDTVKNDNVYVTPHQIADVPMRFVTRRCKTSLAVPSNFNMRHLDRSARPPPYECVRDYVFGIKSAVTSGSCIYPCPLPVNEEDEEMTNKIIYASAALGVVHDTVTNRQLFFEGHDDDITCITVAPGSAGLVATGQLGKKSVVCIWDCSMLGERDGSSSYSHRYNVSDGGLIARVGLGFFQRAVCAVTFSYDSKYICAIGSDDHHAMGIWDIGSGDLIAETASQSGVPPQITSVSWCPSPQFATYINKDHNGLSDVICTTGVSHLKFWSFIRPSQSSSRSNVGFTFRSHWMGRVTVKKPKIFTCSAFVPSSDEGSRVSEVPSYDVVTGGDNGYVFLWRKSKCIFAVDAIHNGAVRCLQWIDAHVYCGGSGGSVVVLVRASLEVVAVYSALPCREPTTAVHGEPPGFGSRSPRSSATGTGRRPVSAPRGRRLPEGEAAAGGGRPSSRVAHISRKGGVRGPKKQWDGPRDHKLVNHTLPSGIKASTDVYSIALIQAPGGVKKRVNGTYTSVVRIFAVTGFGKLMELDTTGSAPANPLLSFHYGPVWAVGTCGGAMNSLILTGGDDKWLCLWNHINMSLEARCRSKAPIRCIDVHFSNNIVSIGMAGGAFAMYRLEKSRGGSSHALVRSTNPSIYSLHEIESRKDCLEDISDIKFSPNGKMLAVGSHDNYIDIYATNITPPTLTELATCSIRQLKRLRGHTSYITHLDWSIDNKFIRSTCGAYELLFWDVTSGKQSLSSFDTLEADASWHTSTCILGFNLMGIWPKHSDGTDVNAVDVDSHHQLVATGDDFGNVNVFNYPCVVKDAPGIHCGGHSSHVMNLKFASRDDSSDDLTSLVTVGGNDNAVMIWRILRT
mmetsp:Transcript_3035/g.4634  ORF Transcript_3035/g.4634 Transcript_3035/m.4634 type:complete len:1138 (-) Transcript_3035:82-3495(-)